MHRLLIAGALALAAASPALASPCLDRIAALEKRVDDAGEAAASTSTGGQGVAAARESQAMQSRNQGSAATASNVPPFQDPSREAQATRRAANEALGGGDQAIQARALLNEARALDKKGDNAGCLAKIADVERRLTRR